MLTCVIPPAIVYDAATSATWRRQPIMSERRVSVIKLVRRPRTQLRNSQPRGKLRARQRAPKTRVSERERTKENKGAKIRAENKGEKGEKGSWGESGTSVPECAIFSLPFSGGATAHRRTIDPRSGNHCDSVGGGNGSGLDWTLRRCRCCRIMRCHLSFLSPSPPHDVVDDNEDESRGTKPREMSRLCSIP